MCLERLFWDGDREHDFTTEPGQPSWGLEKQYRGKKERATQPWVARI
jgi:hypothetical protein